MQNIQKRDDFNTGHKCTWCPGCGNFGIWYMLKQALLELELQPHEIVMVYDVGCNGNGSNFTHTYGFHGLHGRALPVAEGIKLSNNKLKVIVVGGDGGGLGLGAGHFLHACRRNIDITYIMHDNQLYGLTTGQASPRTDKGAVTKTTPWGNIEEPVNPLTLAIDSSATFVARSFSGSPHHLKDTLKQAISHKGFSFVDVLQPCITFNKQNTYAWFNERIYELPSDIDKSDKFLGWQKANEWGEKIPLGVFYKEDKPTFEELLELTENPVDRDLSKPINISSILKKYRI
jgi:2-oxoglutarate ferredoxin oxidoreductase subunit beta